MENNYQTFSKLTSLAPLIIPCSRSICIYCSSSAYASAHGTPRRKALVLITHRALPLNEIVDLVKEVRAEAELATLRRAEGGMISFKAQIRSQSVSASISKSESVEISDSVIVYFPLISLLLFQKGISISIEPDRMGRHIAECQCLRGQDNEQEKH